MSVPGLVYERLRITPTPDLSRHAAVVRLDPMTTVAIAPTEEAFVCTP